MQASLYSSRMNDTPPKSNVSDAHNRHHAEKRRQRRSASHGSKNQSPDDKPWHKSGRVVIKGDGPDAPGRIFLYGLHTVRHALENPDRKKIKLYATKNGLGRLAVEMNDHDGFAVEEKLPRELDKMVGSDAVHQGVVLEAKPIKTKPLPELAGGNLLLVLDQVTDPHNAGAILRSAVAFGVDAVVTTSRHSPVESGVLAKAASGALDMIDHVEVRNLAEALKELHAAGYQTIGLDSDGTKALEATLQSDKIALVLGAEGKGLRQKTRETCSDLARLDMPGAIKSLNVSNATVLALYITRQHLAG